MLTCGILLFGLLPIARLAEPVCFDIHPDVADRGADQPQEGADAIIMLQLRSDVSIKLPPRADTARLVKNPDALRALGLTQAVAVSMLLRAPEVVFAVGAAALVVIFLYVFSSCVALIAFKSLPDAGANGKQGRSIRASEAIPPEKRPSRGQRRARGAARDGSLATSGEIASNEVESTRESDEEERADFEKVAFAIACYLPVQLLISVMYVLAFMLQQLMVLPFRACGGRPLVIVLDLFSPIMSCLTFAFVSTNHGENCYGRVVETFRTPNDFLKSCSAIKRKNIRRNQGAAAKKLEENNTEVTYFPAGTWQLTYEIRALIWHQCQRHAERAHSYADVINCFQPVCAKGMFIGELFLLLSFPCDIQLFRAPDKKLVSLNTRCHVGNAYFNPNYACLEEYSQMGIFAWSHWHAINESIRLSAAVVNFMPSMRAAKFSIGLRPLPLGTLISACLTCTAEPREAMMEEQGAGTSAKTLSREPLAGGRRSARKIAALVSQSSDTAEYHASQSDGCS